MIKWYRSKTNNVVNVPICDFNKAGNVPNLIRNIVVEQQGSFGLVLPFSPCTRPHVNFYLMKGYNPV